MNKTIDKKTRLKAMAFASRALDHAMDTYDEFLDQPVPRDPKGYAEHCKAGQTAIAHIALLMKTMQMLAQAPEDHNEDASRGALEAMMRAAAREVAGFQIERDGEDEFC